MTNELRLNPDSVSWREVDSEILVLDLTSYTYLATNSTGAILWKSLAGGTTRQQLIDQLRDNFEVDEESASRDVDAFLHDLAAQGILAS